MKITPKLRSFLETKGLKAGASDDEALAFVKDALAAGKLTDAEVQSHADDATKSTDTAIDGLLAEKLAPVTKTIAELANVVGEAVKGLAILSQPGEAEGPRYMPFGAGNPENIKGSKAPRVKGVNEQYSSTKGNLLYGDTDRRGRKDFRAGLPVSYGGRNLETRSHLDLAVIGACMKHDIKAALARNVGCPQKLVPTEHDRQLREYAVRECEWTGFIETQEGVKEVGGRKLTELEIKALLDDDTSGGTEAVPLVYDNAVIETSLLYGEVFPFVNTINLGRGQSVHAYSIGRPTVQADVAEGTSIDLFNTAAFIAALDTTIHTIVGAMEFGEDWEEDSPVNLAQIVVKEYGEQVMNYLDMSICVGDGTTQPLGIFNATNTLNIPNISNGVGPLTAGDFESLMWGISKAERNRAGRYMCYIGNDATYRRGRSVPRGSDDAARLYGMDFPSYSINGAPFKVCNDVPSNQLAYVNLNRYRMYRRLGTSFRWVNEGVTLALTNTRAVVMRARVGGQPELGAAFAVMSNAPTQG